MHGHKCNNFLCVNEINDQLKAKVKPSATWNAADVKRFALLSHFDLSFALRRLD